MNFEIDPLYYEDEVYGKRLLISSKADLSELLYNIRAARSILNSFLDSLNDAILYIMGKLYSSLMISLHLIKRKQRERLRMRYKK